MTPKQWAKKAVEEKLLDYPEQTWIERPRREVERAIAAVVQAAIKEAAAGHRRV